MTLSLVAPAISGACFFFETTSLLIAKMAIASSTQPRGLPRVQFFLSLPGRPMLSLKRIMSLTCVVCGYSHHHFWEFFFAEILLVALPLRIG